MAEGDAVIRKTISGRGSANALRLMHVLSAEEQVWSSVCRSTWSGEEDEVREAV